jgi:ribonuclease D
MPQTSKMKDMDPTHFTLVETPESLDLFWQANKNVEWMGFDTEFMGEKRFLTSLCLIQVATRMGTFLIDPLALKNIDPVLEMIQDPSVLKITHAGENDYRLLYAHFGILPRNVFDTQIAAGFIHYKYPLAFKRLVETELRMPLKKGYTVADWEARPFKPQQLEYAVYDILPLHPLWELMQDKLQRLGRGDWVREECRALEQESYYAKDPHHEVLSNQMIRSLNKSEQLFMLRLLEWRGREAERKNYSREMVLPAKYIGYIVKGVKGGKEALLDNRRVPAKIIYDHWAKFKEFSGKEITPEEKAVLQRIQKEEAEDVQEELLIELLYLIVKHHCLANGVSVHLAFPRNALRKIQEDPVYARTLFGQGWRKSLFGEQFTLWLEKFRHLNIHLEPEQIALRLHKAP